MGLTSVVEVAAPLALGAEVAEADEIAECAECGGGVRGIRNRIAH